MRLRGVCCLLTILRFLWSLDEWSERRAAQQCRASWAFLWKQERASHFAQHTAREQRGGKSTCMLKVFWGFPVYLSLKTDRYYYVLVNKFIHLSLGQFSFAKWYTTKMNRLQCVFYIFTNPKQSHIKYFFGCVITFDVLK